MVLVLALISQGKQLKEKKMVLPGRKKALSPKSAIFSWLPLQMSKFANFKSRWQMLLACAYDTPDSICREQTYQWDYWVQGREIEDKMPHRVNGVILVARASKYGDTTLFPKAVMPG